MTASRLRIVFLGSSITSTWGHGHATVYRPLLDALARRGHQVVFLERNDPRRAEHRDQRFPPHGRTVLYRDLGDLTSKSSRDVRDADLVVIGSRVEDGVAVAEWVMRTARGLKAFYDLDTPHTLALLAAGVEDYVSRALVPRFDLYLSVTGGPVLRRIERGFGATRAVPLYPSIDLQRDRPLDVDPEWDLGHLGAYVEDRQPALGVLLAEPARRWPSGRFVVAGSGYPAGLEWPRNVETRPHIAASERAAFYARQRYTLNVTRPATQELGYAPGTRLLEAAAFGVPVITDWWPGLDTFFAPGAEIFVAGGPIDVLALLRDVPDVERLRIAEAARRRVGAEHGSDARAGQLEDHVFQRASVAQGDSSAAAAS